MSRLVASILFAFTIMFLGVLTPVHAEASPATDAVSWALSRQGASYQWGGTGPRFDCSGLTYSAYRAVGVNIPRSSDQQYRATQRIKRSQLRSGDLVFWHGHVELYVGDGRIVGSTTSRGVSVRKFGSWRMDHNVRGYGRLSGVGVASTQQAQAGWSHAQLVRRGSRGPAVREWQAKLRAAKYDCGPVDGIFGPKTHRATIRFQKNRGIQVDGIVGRQTRRAMG